MNPKTRKRLIVVAAVTVALALLVIQSCTIRTPEIRGVVLDAQTKQPVADAWIKAFVDTESLTIQGDVGGVLSLAPPHLRSGKDGKFVIPAKTIMKTPFPLAFGTKADDMIVAARTVDKRGVYKVASIGFWKRKLEVTIYLEDEDKLFREKYPNVTPERLEELREGSAFSNLQTLYGYCSSGRFGIEVAIEKSAGCDDWELDFAIKKHERFLERYGDDSEHAGGVLTQLGYLSKMEKSYSEAIEFFNRALAYDNERNIRFRKSEIKNQVNEIEKLMREQQQGEK